MIRTRENLFPGVNPHLNSRLQNEGESWGEFHNAHVIDIGRAIDAILPNGYLVRPEKGLQIDRSLAQHEPYTTLRARRPDLAIIQNEPSPVTVQSAVPSPVFHVPALDDIATDEFYLSLIIYTVEPEKLGKPVTWIELLSPANKQNGSDFQNYRKKRKATLYAGIALIEIDYLHETPPIVETIPSYKDGEVGSYPYLMLVTNPRPSLKDAQTDVYASKVNTPLPKIPIPLLDENQITLDLNAVYMQTYRSFATFSYDVDYEQLPQRIKTYSYEDQTFIRARLAEIQAEYAAKKSAE